MHTRICLALLAFLPMGAMATEAPALLPNRPHPVRNAVQHAKERIQARKEKREVKRAAKKQTAEPPQAPPKKVMFPLVRLVVPSSRYCPASACPVCQPE